MRFPSPDDLAQAPNWDNYVAAQASAAALRLIPRTAAGVGVAVEREQITLHFRLGSLDEDTQADMRDIAETLELLLGDAIPVGVSYQVTDDFRIDPHDGIRWIFAERADDTIWSSS